MKSYLLARWATLPLLLSAATSLACRSVPVTDRRQFLLTPEGTEMALGASAYREVLQKEPLSTNQQSINMVRRVGRRIADATGVQGYEWQFNVIASDVQNAFCLPGGKVVVYEGLLPVCQSEAGLAVVMSHEIAHAVARHGGERMSQGVLVDGSRQVLSWATAGAAAEQQQLLMKAYGVASEVGFTLPYSRQHESEADQMGLVFMARAGYDPREAPRFWERFASAASGAGKPPEFLSTHPADARRARDLEAQMGQAMQLYHAAPVKLGLGEPISLAARSPRDFAE